MERRRIYAGTFWLLFRLRFALWYYSGWGFVSAVSTIRHSDFGFTAGNLIAMSVYEPLQKNLSKEIVGKRQDASPQVTFPRKPVIREPEGARTKNMRSVGLTHVCPYNSLSQLSVVLQTKSPEFHVDQKPWESHQF